MNRRTPTRLAWPSQAACSRSRPAATTRLDHERGSRLGGVQRGSAGESSAAPAESSAAGEPARRRRRVQRGGGVPAVVRSDKEIKLGFTDGFGGNSWRLVTTAAATRRGVEVPQRHVDSTTPTARATPRRRSPTSRAWSPRASTPSSSSPTPARRSCRRCAAPTRPASSRFPTASTPAARPARTTTSSSAPTSSEAGKLWGQWIVENLPDGGNVLFLSGPPGNSQGTGEAEGLHEVLDPTGKYTFIGEQPFEVTNWDPAETQKVLTAAIAKYPTDRRHRLRLRPVAGRRAAGVREERALDPADRHVRRQRPGLLLARTTRTTTRTSSCSPSRPRTTTPGSPIQWAVALATGGEKPADDVVPEHGRSRTR